jgi:hypothetical protein
MTDWLLVYCIGLYRVKVRTTSERAILIVRLILYGIVIHG